MPRSVPLTHLAKPSATVSTPAHGLTFQSKDELALVLGVGLHEGDEGPRGLVHHAAVVALPVPELGQEIGNALLVCHSVVSRGFMAAMSTGFSSQERAKL